MFSDYEYYSTIYKGALDETEYNKNVIFANGYINRFTYNQAVNVTNSDDVDKLKFCECSLVDFISENNNINSYIASERLGEHDVSFTANAKENYAKDIYDNISLCLGSMNIDGVSIFYKGVCKCECE